MLWLAIHFPNLPREVWTHPHHNTVSGTDAVATQDADGARTRALWRALAQDALRFTPQVCLPRETHGTHLLLLEIGGCLRLFHGLGSLLANIEQHFSGQGVSTLLALAETPGAAQLFACNAIDTRALFDDEGHADKPALHARLGALPVNRLALETRTEQSLMQMGLNRFAEIDALPRQALGRRFGQAFTQWLDRVTGALPDPQLPVVPDTFFVRELNFLDGIVHSDGLLFPMQRLLGDFGKFLRHRQLATQHIVWRCTLVDRSTQEIVINTSQPEISPARLLELTRVRLDTLRLPAPAETLRLACRRFVPLTTADNHHGGLLFPELAADAQRSDSMATLIDRLRARLGDAHCRQIIPLDSWRPEHAQRLVPAGQLPNRLPDALAMQLTLQPSRLARQPLWLLREPLPAEKRGTQLHWRGALTLLDGPERIDSEWWSTPLYRDYFIARHDDGALYWVFHDLAADSWHVHGVFG